MRAAITVLGIIGVVCSFGCGKSSAPTAPSAPPPAPIPPMSRYDTLYVALVDTKLGDHFWTIATQDTSISLDFSTYETVCDGSGNCSAIQTAAIVYDTWDSLSIHVTGWASKGYSFPHELVAATYD